MEANENIQNMHQKFNCVICDYKCSKKHLYTQHLSTSKHQKRSEGLTKANNFMKNMQITQKTGYFCEKCDIEFKHQSSYCRHKKKCNSKEEEKKISISDTSDKELIMMLVKQNSEILEVLKNGTHNTNNSHNTNSLNKTFNLQFFLNETCKDAMNITDFVESIKLQLSDLVNVGEVGYVEGISNIITSNLKVLDVTQRPIHCTDKKREILYVKDEDKWEKEDGDKKKLRKAIKSIAFKNQKMIPEFKKAHPDCVTSDSKYSDQYNKIMIESLGCFGTNDCENEEKIIKKISSVTTIDKLSV